MLCVAYDEALAERIRGVLPDGVELAEQRMFGGLAFLVGRHLAVAAGGHGGLMVRCDPAASDRFAGAPGVSRMVMRGRELDGWLEVDVDRLAGDADLRRWVEVGTTYAGSLPPK